MAAAPCVFCSIIDGEAPASPVYSDDKALAFMTIRPLNAGHVLVVPRSHAAGLEELEPELGAHLFRVGMHLASALRRSGLPCEGVNLFLSDGSAAGQEVFHVHLHVVPRFRGDGFGFRVGPGSFSQPTRAALDETATLIRRALE